MNWLLFFALVLLTLLNFILTQKELLFPSVVVCGVFSASALFLVLNPAWGISISLGTFSLIISCLLCFSLFCYWGYGVTFVLSRKWNDDCVRQRKNSFHISDLSQRCLLLVSLVSIFFSALYFRHQYSLSIELGNRFGIIGVIGTIRSVVQIYPEAFELGIILNMGIAFVKASGYICIFALILFSNNKTSIKKTWLLLIPIVCLVIVSLLSTGRGPFINIFASILYSFYIIRQDGDAFSVKKRIIKYSLLAICIFIVLFRAIGYLTGASAVLNIWDTLSIYIGSPIVCLDHIIKQGFKLSSFWGINTFRGLYNILNRLGLPVPLLSNHSEMFRWQGYSSNIYTSLYCYLIDFGFLATVFIECIIGFIAGTAWRSVKSKGLNSARCIVYGRFWGGALVYYSIAERLLSNYLALNAFVELFFILIIFKILFKNSHKTIIYEDAI